MSTVIEILKTLEQRIPPEMKYSWDNIGLLVGERNRSVSKILVSLDITEAVAQEAVDLGAELIVAHHPVIFGSISRITDEDATGRRLLKLIRNDVAAIAMHTNLDSVAGGVNDVLAERLGLSGIDMLHTAGVDALGRPYGVGRVGSLAAELPLETFAQQVKAALGCNGIRYCQGTRPCHKVAVGGGSCGDMLRDALALGCDTFVTSDVKYDVFLEARSLGLNLLDAGHYATENVISEHLAAWLAEEYPQLEVHLSKASDQMPLFL